MSGKGGTIDADGYPEVTGQKVEKANAEVDAWAENDFSGVCPVRELLDRIGDKWSVLIILRLGRKKERFRSLMRAVGGISQRMLTVTLRSLERDGLVNREVFDTRPPSVEYSLTPLGFSLLDHLTALASWAMDHNDEVKIAQKEAETRYQSNSICR